MNYLKYKASRYEYESSFFLAIIVVISFVFGKYLPLKNPWIYIPIFFLWLIFVVVLQFLSQKSQQNQFNYIKGDKGELFLEGILKKLPNNYHYKRGIKFKNGGDLDFLVISENGIFGIENKNISGKITYDEKNKQLLRNHYPFDDKYLKQLKNNCFKINEIIKNKLNINIFVTPILVFSGLGVSIETPAKVDGVYVLSSDKILNFLISSKSGILDEPTKDNIYKLFNQSKN